MRVEGMKSDSPESVSDRVQHYLDEALSIQELSTWLLSKTAYFAKQPRQSHDAELWARACNLVSLYGDSALPEEGVRAALNDWLAKHPSLLAHTATPR